MFYVFLEVGLCIGLVIYRIVTHEWHTVLIAGAIANFIFIVFAPQANASN